MRETLYDESHYRPPELEHAWGERLHLLDDPLALGFLARLGSPNVTQPEVGRLLRRLYEGLAWAVIAAEFPRGVGSITTRMATAHPGAAYEGTIIDPRAAAVTVGIARGGTVPSQIVYELLNEVLEPSLVRQDHLVMSRVLDAEGKVTGVEFLGSKAGRDVAGRYILIPDPMGATGGSMSAAVDHYKRNLDGTPARIIAMHLIVTPEYCRRMIADHPDVVVYALRYDRGLSPAAAFGQPPGTSPDERGLDAHDYIVPGAGGLGEVLNNAWI